jgi:hypothetical protein
MTSLTPKASCFAIMELTVAPQELTVAPQGVEPCSAD